MRAGKRINLYSDYLKEKYGEKVYKLPINVAGTCPNRDGTLGIGGCTFCAESGAGYDSLSAELSVREQLQKNRAYIGKKYKAQKFIAYFQNYCNTYMPTERFRSLVQQAMAEDVVEISISTRPDCVRKEHLEFLHGLKQETQVETSLELGLQTANYHTLLKVNRGHTLAEFIRAVNLCHQYHISICAHVILNLPWDDQTDVTETAKILSALGVEGVKLHSLNILKGTQLAEQYKAGEFPAPDCEEYICRTLNFLAWLDEDIVVHRLIGRAPENISVIENFNMSWRRVYDEIIARMERENIVQGMCYKENKLRY